MVEFALDLGTAYEWVGNLYWDLGQREQAVQQFQQGLDHILARVRSYPDVPTYQRQLVENSRKLSTRLREVGRKEEARTTLLHACQALASLPEPTGENLYLLAGLQAQSAALIGHGKTELTPDEHAQERRELDAARATLRRAIAAGFKDFGRVKNDLKLMRNDPSSKAMLERYGVSFASFERSILSDAAAKDFKAAVAKGEGQGAKEAQDKQSGDPARNPKLLKADLARSRLAIGLLNSEFGKHRESAQALAEALSIRQELARSDPKNVQYQEDLASAYIAQGHVDWRAGRAADANRKWQKGLDLLHQAFHDPSQEQQLTAHLVSFELALGNRYAEVGLWSEAADHYAQAFAKQPPGNPLDWAFFAPVLLLNGDVSEYRRLCTNMLHQFGDTPGIQWVFEIIYGASLGSTEASEVARWVQLAEGELAVQPHLDWRMSKLAQALYRAGRFKDSLQAFQQSPNLIEGWPVRAMVHHRLGQTESARQWLAKADDSSKKTIQYALARDSLLLPWYPWWRNWAGFQIVRHEAKELIEGSPVPDDPWLRLLRGRAYAKLGLPEKADSDFQAAVAVNPKDPEIWRARSKVFAQLGQTDRAKADFAKAMELKP
jgi:tetratricopeptide (TPR) repeat protein